MAHDGRHADRLRRRRHRLATTPPEATPLTRTRPVQEHMRCGGRSTLRRRRSDIWHVSANSSHNTGRPSNLLKAPSGRVVRNGRIEHRIGFQSRVAQQFTRDRCLLRACSGHEDGAEALETSTVRSSHRPRAVAQIHIWSRSFHPAGPWRAALPRCAALGRRQGEARRCDTERRLGAVLRQQIDQSWLGRQIHQICTHGRASH